MSRSLDRPTAKDVCTGCGVNLQVWPYAFGLEYRRIRLKFFGPTGFRKRYPSETARAWTIYEAALADLRAAYGAIAKLGVRSAKTHVCAA